MTRLLPLAVAAMRRLEMGRFDLVLLDLNLPDMDRYAALSGVLDRPDPPTVLCMSGDDSPDVARAALAYGALDFAPKPVRIDAIRDALAASVGRVADAAPSGSAESRSAEPRSAEPDLAPSIRRDIAKAEASLAPCRSRWRMDDARYAIHLLEGLAAEIGDRPLLRAARDLGGAREDPDRRPALLEALLDLCASRKARVA